MPPLPPCSRFTLLLWPRGEQCGGCRRSNTTDRPHAFQVVLADRPCLELSAESEAEMADWMQHLCQAVSKGVSGPAPTAHLPPNPSRTPRVPSPNPHKSWNSLWGSRRDSLGGNPGALGHSPSCVPPPTLLRWGSLPDL